MKRIFWKFYDPGTGAGAGGGETEEQKKQALLTEIQNKVKTEIETRGYQNAAAVTAAISESLKGMNLDALRSYDADKTKMETTIRNLAAEQEKLNARSKFSPNGEPVKEDPIREMLEANRKEIETRFKNVGQKSEFKFDIQTRAAAVMTTANTVDNSTHSIPIAMIDSMSMDSFAKTRRGVQFINDIADRRVVANITKYKTWLEEGTEEGAFAIVAEGALKPLVSTGIVRNYAQAKKIAGKYVVTEEFAKFFEEAYSIIRGLINDKLTRDYSALLVTDLNAQAASYTGTALDGTIEAPNDYDAVAAVASQIMALNFVPDVLIVHPDDLWRIRLTKDEQGRYLFPVQNTTGGIDMFGFNVVTSTYQTAGSFTLGESKLFKIEEEPITVRMGYGVTVTGSSPVTQVVSDFDNNMFRVIVETYFLDWIPTPYIGSFVKTSFATVKTALLAVTP